MPYKLNKKAYFYRKDFPEEGVFILPKDLQANEGVFHAGDKVYLKADMVDTAAGCINFTVMGADDDCVATDRFSLHFSEVGDGDMSGKAGAYMLRQFGDPLESELEEYKQLTERLADEEDEAVTRNQRFALAAFIAAIAAFAFLLAAIFAPVGRVRHIIFFTGFLAAFLVCVYKAEHYDNVFRDYLFRRTAPEIEFFRRKEG